MLKIMTICAAALAANVALAAEDVTPLAKAHAHNDYEHERPLLDALSYGFTGFEADIWLVDGELLVAHDEDEIEAGRTLQKLYLDPLQARIEENGGQVYAAGTDRPVMLLIDIKSDGAETYEALSAVLEDYDDMLTTYRDGEMEPGAVTAVISGNRPREMMEAQDVRHAGYDGRMDDLESDIPASFMPLLSDNWTKHFDWMGEGEMPGDQRARLDDIVTTAHDKGWQVRFWATPDEAGPAREAIWTVLDDAGVDRINTDDLGGLQDFLQSK
ncbi:phosphatidylinositol-specific phospholipase C/glycerophosphodiester phosphodiesterase family protein [uncultured Jannaschia sp.]|uniref:phosphatidylinositol-specific phospholipase C/glycerophosphodiester phosphodiesterase family protein n=1 Tax=uncultured Jannaschia sp. TaxID=293347 RepID=UPI00262B591F|nr:phosphatidylinositol-specific phospholipase C/glycerophosphodiester phosphodiesterase family protein [uncultured Jannaschia sp.]